jgi:mannobiose 2-epimerase
METGIISQIKEYSSELRLELEQILKFWEEFTPDHIHGGFVGKISNENLVDEQAVKGAVLNARILWSFSAAYNAKAIVDLDIAERAYHYITDHFIDKDYGGVYWTVDFEGNPKDTKKQVYALAFTIYALSEYFIASGNEVVKEHAVIMYHDLIKHSFDPDQGGFFEAFNREWEPIADLRLSDKDENEKKTMNTHLHVLEAFTNLYRIWPDADLKDQIEALLKDFITHIVDPRNGHLVLFFEEDWTKRSGLISYGHDIEASWLLLEAAEVIAVQDLVAGFQSLALKMAEASLSGLDEDGSLWYEKEGDNEIIKERHWWVQAEGMIGFFNAWQLSGDERFLTVSLRNWEYVKKHLLDKENGEWFWGIKEDGTLMAHEDKVGLWKCPYHNSRACLELIQRIERLVELN